MVLVWGKVVAQHGNNEEQGGGVMEVCGDSMEQRGGSDRHQAWHNGLERADISSARISDDQ